MAIMPIMPDEETKPPGAGAEGSSPRTSELDLTKRNTGPAWRQYLRAMGPGLVTGASDDDPSGIATYAQAGAKYGLSFLWTALLTLPLMVGVQEICDRTALRLAPASANSPSSVSTESVDRSWPCFWWLSSCPTP
jgi:Mn2+/Fe2+ NRAMP family transporter